jgi:hypothetical protein
MEGYCFNLPLDKKLASVEGCNGKTIYIGSYPWVGTRKGYKLPKISYRLGYLTKANHNITIRMEASYYFLY